jgi:hypothetical protein
MEQPNPFLSVVLHKINNLGDEVGLCAGFERGEWRCGQLAEHVMEWLPEFALNHSELCEIGHHNAVRMIKKAARIVYQTEKYGLRGEFGEILLHIALRQVYKTVPAVSKIYYKSSVNKTVEGFDAVHVIVNNGDLELWIGETKFYNNIDKAIRDVCIEIIDHLETDYLRSEFLFIKNKIDPSWPEAESLKSLLEENVSLDEIFNRICIPILLTYDSDTVKKSNKSDTKYLEFLKLELTKCYRKMRSNLSQQYKNRFKTDLPLTVHIILIPLKAKAELIKALDCRLKELQG